MPPRPIAPSWRATRTTSIRRRFPSQAIEAYRKGGFAQLVLDGKRDYVEHYNLGTTFWQGRNRADYPQIVTEIKTHLTDLAAYYHSEAQKSKKPEDYAQAAHWYRLQLQSFPDDLDAAQVNIRLADVLYEGGQFGAAVDEYERTAYTYPPGPDSAKAGYAALNAYQKQEPLLSAAEKVLWKSRSIESGVRFAQAFPAASGQRRRADARHAGPLHGQEPAARHRSGRAAGGAQSAGRCRAASHRLQRDRPVAV